MCGLARNAPALATGTRIGVSQPGSPFALRLRGGAQEQLVSHPAQPSVVRQSIRPEFLELALLFVIENRPVDPQAAGFRRVHQVGGIAGTHLEQHPHGQIVEQLAVDPAVEVGEVVAPDQRMDAVVRAFAQQRAELLVQTGRRRAVVQREAVLFRFAQFPKASQIVDDQKSRRRTAVAAAADGDRLPRPTRG